MSAKAAFLVSLAVLAIVCAASIRVAGFFISARADHRNSSRSSKRWPGKGERVPTHFRYIS